MVACAPIRLRASTWFGLLALLVLGTTGCQVSAPSRIPNSDLQSAPAGLPRARLGHVPCAAVPVLDPNMPLDLPVLWQLAIANNPSLRMAEADVEVARGAQFQAGRYPNPHFHFNEDTIGSRTAPPGNMSLQITQEIVTAGKRKLDMNIAARETDAAILGHMNRRFEVL